MTNKRNSRKKDYSPHIELENAQLCESDGCSQKGIYKAPKAKNQLHEYHWLCLDHIREHNKKWDYFSNMDGEEIEAFMHDAVTGHRPTWNRETQMRNPMDMLQDAFYEFISPDAKKVRKAAPHLSAKQRKALGTMDMEYPITIVELKTQYRALVKKHHPDVNKGDKRSEEHFKKITESYNLLAAYLESKEYKT